MVQWKGEIGEDSGQKAQLLDTLDKFNVPNFFVITPDEVGRLFKSETDSNQVLNASLNMGVKRELKDAYDEVGMSSEVREASGKAKSLVGGQRNGQLVTIRISSSEKEKYNYKLNVGSSNFFQALKEVVASYYKYNGSQPSVIVQKMVEPGFTGALTSEGSETIVETVKGIGTSLEEGLTQPNICYLRGSRLEKRFLPKEQLEISRNPVRGENQRKEIEPEEPFEREELEKFVRKTRSEDLNLKFVYKRGGFHVVDASRSQEEQGGFSVSENGLRVSKGEINGVIGQKVEFSDQTTGPEEYQDALIAKKGGFTSRDAYHAREADKPAIFRYKGNLEQGQRVTASRNDVDVEKRETREKGVASSTIHTGSSEDLGGAPGFEESKGSNPFRKEEESKAFSDEVLATEVLAIDPRKGRGVFLKRKGSKGYSVDSQTKGSKSIPREGYLSSFEDVFAFEGGSAVLDARRIPARGLEEALEYLQADTKVLLVENPERELLQKAVESGVDAIGCPENRVERVSEVVASFEKKFIMDKLRDI